MKCCFVNKGQTFQMIEYSNRSEDKEPNDFRLVEIIHLSPPPLPSFPFTPLTSSFSCTASWRAKRMMRVQNVVSWTEMRLHVCAWNASTHIDITYVCLSVYLSMCASVSIYVFELNVLFVRGSNKSSFPATNASARHASTKSIQTVASFVRSLPKCVCMCRCVFCVGKCRIHVCF